MNWYKIAKEEPIKTPMPAMPRAGPDIGMTVEERSPLPDTPEFADFWDIMKTAKHFHITCSNCGDVHQCRCLTLVHKKHPQVKATVPECSSCA